jgi:outer membrane protein assembly factor BamE (lipoprotein component of BamABCDE complex)
MRERLQGCVYFPGLVLVLGLLAFGCGETVLTQWPKEQIFGHYFRLQEVRLGMSKTEVESVMGPPSVQEVGDFRGGRYTFYFYRTHNMDYEGSGTVRGGYTPLVFQQNRLVGKGKRDYYRAADQLGEDESPAPPWQRRSW